mmetsp:Transcript_16872/g.38109  ORF Transcript_16872/g.38109 Transcript_16872/m.38109 type:complete len:463 (-) Transcript_16872:69-1457(-)
MEDKPADWPCPNASCWNHTNMVFGTKSNCPKCGSAKGDEPQQQAAGNMGWGGTMAGFGMQQPKAERGMFGGDMPGDWACPNVACRNHTKMVFAKRTSCPSCGAEKDTSVAGMEAAAAAPSGNECWGGMMGGMMGGMTGGMMGGTPVQQPKSGKWFSGDTSGDWQCPNSSCINHTRNVFAKRTSCPSCGASRDSAVPTDATGLDAMLFGMDGMEQPPHPERGMHGGDMPNDWQCPNTDCLNHIKMVFGKKLTCPSCGTARNDQPGDWQCTNPLCLNHNNTVFASQTNCPSCGTLRAGAGSFGPVGQAMAMRPAGPYQMSANPMQGFGKGFEKGCGKGFEKGFDKGCAKGCGKGGWDNGMGGMGNGPVNAAPGDWPCPNPVCMNNTRLVFAKNQSCPKCGTPKPMKQVRSDPGDWQCPNLECLNSRNSVFAKHANCPACGSAKPPPSNITTEDWLGPPFQVSSV